MEIIKNFGFDPVLLGAQIVNFLIILYFLRRFLYKPVFDVIKKRETTIKEGLVKAEEAQKMLEKSLEEERKILKKAQSSATKIIEDAKNQAIEMAKQTEEETKKQTEKLIKEAKNEITQETKHAEQQLSSHVSTLAVEILQKTMQELFSDKEQEEIMMKAIKKLKQKPN